MSTESSDYTGRRVTAFRRLVAATYGLTCHLCGDPIASLEQMDVDHLTARSHGGDLFDLANARPSHGRLSPPRYRCNQKRKRADVDTYRARRDVDSRGWFGIVTPPPAEPVTVDARPFFERAADTTARTPAGSSSRPGKIPPAPLVTWGDDDG